MRSHQRVESGIDWPQAGDHGFPVNKCEPTYDPCLHLQLEPPQTVKTLDFIDVPFPYTASTLESFSGLAYSAPFRFLSADGTQVLRSIIDDHAHMAKPNDRNVNIRGLGYMSRFLRDLSFCPEVVGLFSALANEPLWPHNMGMNLGHTNFGEIGSDKAVDEWHTDSTDYVYVLILSDITDMVGGELQVLQLADSSGEVFNDLKVHGIPMDKVQRAAYPGAGYCIFMQGSKILHSVTPVLDAKEPRISMVNSFSRRDCFAPDRTRMCSLRDQAHDPADISNLEYARHKAWRVAGQMKHIIEKVPFGTKPEELAEYFEDVVAELQHANKLLRSEATDMPGYINGAGKTYGDQVQGITDPTVLKAQNLGRSRL